ncbi:uncharacterized protein C8orf76-like isoform X2 [Panulirus ornatus]
MEFANFDDDLFEEKHQRGGFIEEYSARMCEPCWFMQVHPEHFVSPDDEFSATKYVADYLYLSKKYDAALTKYEEILNMLRPGNTTITRECLESLVRCHIKKGTPCKAINYADELHQTSKNSDQATVSCSVLFDVNIAAERFSDALIAAQTLVTLHPENYHLWIKLGYVYACIYKISLPNIKELVSGHLPCETVTPCHNTSPPPVQDLVPDNMTVHDAQTPKMKIIVEDNFIGKQSSDEAREDSACQTSKNGRFTHKERGLQFVAACLQRSFVILKKTVGTAQGFALNHNLTYQKNLINLMNFLLDEDLLHCVRAQVRQHDEAQSSLPVTEETTEFIDRGSSKFKSNESEADVEVVCQNSFEDYWFKWIK